MDAASALLGKLDIPQTLTNGPVGGDAALLTFDKDDAEAGLSAFIDALVQHRNFDRESAPPRIRVRPGLLR